MRSKNGRIYADKFRKYALNNGHIIAHMRSHYAHICESCVETLDKEVCRLVHLEVIEKPPLDI